MSKKIAFLPKPGGGAATAQQSPDEWVKSRATGKEALKRFTFDIPADLHARIKMDCAKRGTHMADEIRALLEKNWPFTA